MPAVCDWIWLSPVADVAAAITGIVALALAAYSLRQGRKTLETQDRHNQLSVKPMPWVACGDYENSIYVRIDNRGLGPLIIKEFEARWNESKKTSLIAHMPPSTSITWTDFTEAIAGRTLLPSGELYLIRLDIEETTVDSSIFIELCRLNLGNIDVYIKYTDMYENDFEIYHRKLDWFHRS